MASTFDVAATTPHPKPIYILNCDQARALLGVDPTVTGLMFQQNTKQYWRYPEHGGTPERNRARAYQGSGLGSAMAHGDVNTVVEIIAMKELPVGKCNISLVLPVEIHKLLKLAPTNPVVRTHVLNAIGQALPDEAQTYDQIKEWIENNIAPKRPMLPADPNRRVIAVTVRASMYERGTCNYERRYGMQTSQYIKESEVLEALEGFGGTTLDDLAARICGNIAGEVTGDELSETSCETSNHDVDEVGEVEASVATSQASIATAIKSWMETFRPDLLEKFQDTVTEPEPNEEETQEDETEREDDGYGEEE